MRALVREFGYTAHIRARGEQARALTRRPRCKARRWVVERTHRWLNRYRRILIRWEKTVENDVGTLHLACGLIAFRASGLLG